MNNKNCLYYFLQGCTLIQKPGIRRYVILPMLANIVLMSLLFYWYLNKISLWVDYVFVMFPSWMQWLSYVITFILVIIFAIFFGYFFSSITNFIAAPFNGLLAEQVEAILTGSPAPETTFADIICDLPRIMKREVQKFVYYIVWAIPLLISFLIPILGQVITPVLWFIFTAWMINIQYTDYAFDNHKISFQHMRKLLSLYKIDNIGFGAIISFFTMIPLVNLFIMPIAVCAATAMYVDRYRS